MEPAPIVTPGLPGADAIVPGAKKSPAPLEPVTAGEWRASAVLFGVFVVNILLAVLFAVPFRRAHLQAFENPQDTSNAIWYIVFILIFTFVILWIARKKIKWLIRVIILFAVGSTIAYVVGPILAIYLTHGPYWFSDALLGAGRSLDLTALGGALALSIASVVALYKHPEWYVIDSVGLLVAAGSAAIFGISFGILPVLLLLALLAVYDAIAVYRTKHMLSLADTVIDLRLPVLLVIPKHAGYRFKAEAGKFKEASAENKGEREAMFMGLGDLVMPTMLVVSALMFLPGLIMLPLHASADAAAGHDGLPVDVQVQAGQGHPLNATYLLTSSDAASASWNWTVDLNEDGMADHQGRGLPATFTDVYDQPVIVPVQANVTASNGQVGSFSAYVTIDYAGSSDVFTQFVHSPVALGAAVGTLAGFVILMGFVLRGNPQAGLPLLNGGAIAGFLIGLYAVTGSVKFW